MSDVTQPQVTPYPKQPREAKRKPWHSSVAWKSDKRLARKPLEERMLARLLERDGGCVVAGEAWFDGEPHVCEGPPVPHHRRKANACGGYTATNLVLLCVQANNDVEDEPDWVRERYPWLVVREGDAAWDECGGQA